jgi:LPS sulfotransferase NodH
VRKPKVLRTVKQLAFGYGLAPFLRLVGPDVRFIVIAIPRSGSTLLTGLLDAHPDLRCEPEILRRRMPGVRVRRFIEGRAVAVRIQKRVRGYGCKAVVEQVTDLPEAERSTFISGLQRRGFHIIVLRRRDVLASAVSALQALQTGKWHYRVGTEVPSGSIVIEPADLFKALEQRARERAFLDTAIEGVPHIALTYEDDLATPPAQQATLDRLCSAFGLPSAPADPRFVRVGTEEVPARIANYDEVMEALRQSPFAALAEPVASTRRAATEPSPPPVDG